MTKLFTKEELMIMNEKMLGRGAPVEEDGIGYNKGDYGACVHYFYGLSNAQFADLAKRLVKYCNTQLILDKEDMQATHKHFEELAEEKGYSKDDGISLNITENGTLISFRYNETFIETIKHLPRNKRRWDGENKNWIVNNDSVIPLLNELWTVGADVDEALQYAMRNDLIKNAIERKTKVLAKFQDNEVFLKFDYDKEVVDAIKEISKTDRTYNPQFKFWSINVKHWENLKEKLQLVADFKQI